MTFALLNPARFHRPDGEAYELVADQVLALDRLNPKVGSRLAAAFSDWRRFEPVRRRGMERALERMRSEARSTDVGEVVAKALR